MSAWQQGFTTVFLLMTCAGCGGVAKKTGTHWDSYSYSAPAAQFQDNDSAYVAPKGMGACNVMSEFGCE